MQIKRFEAKTMTAALKLVKDEFGPDAVILSARSLRQGRGLFGARTAGVEVTAAKDSGWAAYGDVGRGAAAAEPAQRPAAVTAPSVRRPGLLQSLNHGWKSLAARRGAPSTENSAGEAPAGLADLYQHLLAQDVRRELAADVIEQVKRCADEDLSTDDGRLRRTLGDILRELGPQAPHGVDGLAAPRTIALVGPPGVGKTTTAVKIAADHCARKNQRVALVTLDDLRIGALEQMRIYAEILHLPMASATSAAEARQAVADLGPVDCIIVDTPGISPAEDGRLAALQEILTAFDSKEVHLVLSASTREKDLLRTIEFWKGCSVDRLAFTRVDETGTRGSLVNLPVSTRLPLSYVCNGPRVPGDLALGSVESVVALLLPPQVGRPAPTSAAEGIRWGRGTAEPPGRFVANRNSDLYHLTDCKWVGKIKSANLIRFATAAEAESKRFQPCRNCSPEQADSAGNLAVSGSGARSLGWH